MKFEGITSFSPVAKIVAVAVIAFGGFVLFNNSALAAVGDVTDISLYDGNGNGKIDEVRVSIENTLNTTWTKNGTPAFTAESGDGGAAITVVSSSFYSTQTDSPVILSIALDENDADLTTSTAATAVALVYTQAGGGGACAACFTNGSVELAGIATGDTGAGNTEVDAAKPVVTSATFYDATSSDGKLDIITVVYSEDISAAADGSADWAISSAADFASLVEGSVVCNTAPSAANECDYNFTTATAKTDVGDLTLTYTAGISVVDSAANTANTIALNSASSPAFADGAAPQIKTATYQDTDANGKIDQFTLAFTETLDAASTLAQENLSLSSVGDFNSAAFGPLAVDLVGAVASVAIPLGTEASVLDTKEDVGTIAITSADGGTITFSLTDGTNENTTPKAEAQITFADGAAPQIKTATYQDTDANGKIDQFTLAFTETLDAASTLAQENLSLSSVGDFNSAAFGPLAVDLVGAVASVAIPLGTEASVVDTKEDVGTIAITSADGGTITFSLTDGTNENTTPKAETQITWLDKAKPVIKSTTPTDASIAQSRTDAVVWTFSEPIATAGGWAEGDAGSFEFESTPDPGGWGTAAWSSSDTVVTMTHTLFLCATSYSITTDDTQIAAANGETGYTALNDAATAPIGTALTFTAMTCSGTSGTDETETTYELSLDAPIAGAELTGGEYFEIEWTSSPESQYYVDIYYMDASGDYVLIADAQPNTGSYSWLVPEINLSATDIYLDWNDLADSMDTAFSDDFSIVTVDATAEDTSDDETDAVESGEYGTNPFTGETEEIDVVETGDYFTSSETSTVYYLDTDGTRRPFMNGAAYFTWADSWNEVMEVSGATLAEYTLGTPMLPREGVTMVKIQSDAKTYVIEGDNTLRWVVSEEVAEGLYGANWNAYIIDIEPTFFTKFIIGDDVNEASDYSGLNGKTAKSRATLSA